MRLYLMRHGLAIDREDSECPSEAERYLTPKGISRTREIAKGLNQIGISPTVLFTSPYVRAIQTGEIVCAELGLDPKEMHATDALKPEAAPSRLAEVLERLTFEEAICFGHAPHLDDFIAHALHASAPMTALKKAGVACLELRTIKPPLGQLRWLLTPRLLRDVAR